MKEIKLFEAFAGIGAQYKALKNISKEMNWNIKQVGIIEWFIPAIISYVSIHSNNEKQIESEREREREDRKSFYFLRFQKTNFESFKTKIYWKIQIIIIKIRFWI